MVFCSFGGFLERVFHMWDLLGGGVVRLGKFTDGVLWAPGPLRRKGENMPLLDWRCWHQ